MLFRAISCVGLLTAASGAAHACDLQITDASSQLTVKANSAQLDAPALEQFDFRVRNSSDTDCRFRVAIGQDTTTLATTGNFPATTLTSPSGSIPLENLSVASSGQQANYGFEQTVGGNSEIPLSLSFRIKTGWETPSGLYSSRLNLFLTDETGAVDFDFEAIDLAIDVPASISVRVAGDVNRLDLGELSPTQTTVSPRFALRVFSTDRYDLNVSSANRGHLVRDGGQATIPYELRLDGERIELQNGVSNLPVSDPPGSLGRLLPVVVTVLPDPERLAGRYSDTITVTVSTI